jgi:hypothetical protein
MENGMDRKNIAVEEERGAPLVSGTIFITGALIMVVLCLTSLYSYLLFHSLAELFSIVVAAAIFMLAWNSRRFMDNDSLLFLGIGYLFVSLIDLLHTLAYTGMPIFTGYDTDLPTQLWIAARYMESVTLLFFPLFFLRRLRPILALSAYGLGTVVILTSL